MFTKAQKEELVSGLTKRYKDASLVLFTDYQGLSVEKISTLRGNLYERYEDKAKYQIMKNTLVRIALRNADLSEDEWKNDVDGTTAILTIVDDDPIEALKIVTDFAKANKLPAVRAGYLEGKYFDAEQAIELSKLPSKEQLIAMVVGGLAAPITGLVYSLNGVLTKFLYALNAIKEKKEN